MKILVVVSEFPKITETFAYRNIVEYDRLSHEPWLFHIKPFRRNDVVHGFFEPMMPRVFSYSYFGARTLAAFLAEWARAPLKLSKLTATLVKAHWKEPKRGLAVAALFPKSVALGRWCRRESVAHIHGEFAGHPANAAMIASEIADLPFSFTAHANDIFVSQAMLVEKAQRAKFIRTISAFNVRFLEKLEGFPTDKLNIIRCGVADDAMQTAPLPALEEDGLRILYVGSLIRKKGVRHLLDALAKLPDGLTWRARILGGGNLLDELRQQAAALGLADRVVFEGPQPSEAVMAANRDAHVLVVPSILGKEGRVEGIPVVLMEAMANGRLVIASALSGIPELVEEGVTGRLVEPGDSDAIAAALTEATENWDETKRIAQAGRCRIAEQYLISNNARELARMMEETSQ